MKVNKSAKKDEIGILGGSFDPVHNGHIFLAQYVMENCKLNRVIMIPTGVHPFKLDNKVLSGEHRLAMLQLATENITGVEVSDIEINSPEVSYTYVTLRKLQDKLNNKCKLSFIVGTDEILQLERWYRAEDLLREFAFIVGVRPNYEMETVSGKIENLRERWNADIKILNLPAPDVSSTEVRQAIAEHKGLQGLVPDKVNLYIKKNRLYTGGDD